MSQSTEQKIYQIISEQLRVDMPHISPDSNLVDDLGADSLDGVELLMTLENVFDIEIDDNQFDNRRVSSVHIPRQAMLSYSKVVR
jgi:acyl carrier protein